MQIRWNPPAEAEAIDSIFSMLDGENLVEGEALEQSAPPVPPAAETDDKPAASA